MADGATTESRIVVCTDCRRFGAACRPGLALIERLNDAVAVASPASTGEFAVEGAICLTTCGRPCTIAFRAGATATYLFGDIAADADMDVLVDFARLLRALPDGFNQANPPHGLLKEILARIPAAVIACESPSPLGDEQRSIGCPR